MRANLPWYRTTQEGAKLDVESAVEWAMALPEPDMATAQSLVTSSMSATNFEEPDAGARKLTYPSAITEAMH